MAFYDTTSGKLVKSKKEGKDQKSIRVPHLTQDTTWESNKYKIKKRHIQESQEVSPFPEGDHKAAMNRQETRQTRNTNNKNAPQKKHRIGTVSKKHYWRV